MSNQEVFPPFRPAPTGSEPKTERKKRGSKPPATPSASDSTAKKRRKPRPVSVPVELLPHLAGMSVNDATTLAAIMGTLQGLSKGSRRKIATALAEMFVT